MAWTASVARRAFSPPFFEADGFRPRIIEHVTWMEVRSYAHSTIAQTERSLIQFAAWCEKRGVERPAQVNRPLLERYARHLFEAENHLGTSLSTYSQYNQLSALRVFLRALARRNHVLFSPANDLEFPKLGLRLPRAVLNHEEMERVLGQPNIAQPAGLRDRALLETLYSTGVRRTELTELQIMDLDLGRGTLLVRQGKGRRDRVVPLGERASDWIERYVLDVRPQFAREPDNGVLYLTAYGAPLSPSALSHRVAQYVKAAGVGKEGSCHIFRHTMATQILERGADVRVIQEILGHQKLDTTNIYTRISIAHLKEVHERTHPSAKRGPLAQLEVDVTAAPLDHDDSDAPTAEIPESTE